MGDLVSRKFVLLSALTLRDHGVEPGRFSGKLGGPRLEIILECISNAHSCFQCLIERLVFIHHSCPGLRHSVSLEGAEVFHSLQSGLEGD